MPDESVGSGSGVIGFSMALLEGEPFPACCGIPHVIHFCLDRVCRCDRFVYSFTKEESCNMCIDL